jgi:hypothetical protein
MAEEGHVSAAVSPKRPKQRPAHWAYATPQPGGLQFAALPEPVADLTGTDQFFSASGIAPSEAAPSGSAPARIYQPRPSRAAYHRQSYAPSQGYLQAWLEHRPKYEMGTQVGVYR